MATRDYFSHDTLGGAGFAERIRTGGYPTPGGENIARGQTNARSVHDAWIASPGHRANIITCGFTTIGVGLNTSAWVWTEDFGY